MKPTSHSPATSVARDKTKSSLRASAADLRARALGSPVVRNTFLQMAN